MDKINTGISKDWASKGTNIGERLGFNSSSRGGDRPGVIVKAPETASKVTTEVKEEAKGMVGKAQQQLRAPLNTPRSQRRRRSSLMSKQEITTDFLANYSYEIRTEIGEPGGLAFAFDPALAPLKAQKD